MFNITEKALNKIKEKYPEAQELNSFQWVILIQNLKLVTKELSSSLMMLELYMSHGTKVHH